MSKSRVVLNIVLVAIIALLVAIPGAASAAPQASTGNSGSAITSSTTSARGGCWYRVRWGETLAQIAWHRYTSASHLRWLNGLRSANRIYAGQWLLVPCSRR